MKKLQRAFIRFMVNPLYRRAFIILMSVISILSEKQRKCNPETDSGRVTVPEVHGWPENIIVQRINRT